MYCSECGTLNEEHVRFCKECGASMEGSEKRFGGFWIRVGAYVIDILVLIIPIVIVAVVLGSFARVVVLIGVWLYFSLMESSSKQATFGKMAFGLRVTDMDGRQVSFGRATGRYFGKYVSSFILCIGYMMAGWTAKKQALHDLMAGTVVIKAKD